MMSQTATPISKPHPTREPAVETQDAAYVSTYNSDDYADFLYQTPAFASGFLPLEPPHEPATSTAAAGSHPVTIPFPATVRPSETCNTGTTPPPRSVAAAPKSALKHASTVVAKPAAQPSKCVRVDAAPTTPSETATSHWYSWDPMSWWPERDEAARHTWVEKPRRNSTTDDEEALWDVVFYE